MLPLQKLKEVEEEEEDWMQSLLLFQMVVLTEVLEGLLMKKW